MLMAGLGRPLEAAAQEGQVQWSGVERVVAFADVHGAHAELLRLLRETGIVDGQDRWMAGHAHVVSLGDLLDRGADSRKVMNLLMRLQGEAQAAGGRLHVVLGNHEAMNLLGDLRDVHIGEYAAYADMESAAERALQRKAWVAAQGEAAAAAFDQRFPPGFFGHRAALSPGGPYGRWLLSQPVAIAVNDTLFMHAGPSQALLGMSLQEVNLRYRSALTNYLGLAGRLEQANLLQADDKFHLRPKLARERFGKMMAATAAAAAGTPTVDTALSESVARFEAADDQTLLSSDGPNWYRGPALCREATESDVLLPLLQQFGVARLVVGHTPTRDARAVTRFDGRVVKLDAGMNHAVYKGRAVALIQQGTQLSLQYAGEFNAAPLLPEALHVAPGNVDDTTVLAALSAGEITATEPRGPNEWSVAVVHEGRRIPAVFQVRDADTARREVAAYRLDRQLGLGLVPVTVLREHQGQPGVLQARPAQWVTQTEVQARSMRRGGWCDAERQFQLVYAFDTLIGNDRRSPDSLLYDANAWTVFVTAHQRAFATSNSLPSYLAARPPQPGAEVRRRIGALHQEGLATLLGDLTDERQRWAILQRRDRLLALPAATAANPGDAVRRP
jgi:hypothetical protein